MKRKKLLASFGIAFALLMLLSGIQGVSAVQTTATNTPIFNKGIYFPKLSHSKLEFVAHATSDYLNPDYTAIRFSITRVNDAYTRYLYVYVNGQKIKQFLISGGTTTFTVSHNGENGDLITLEIYYGGYATRGWRLNYAYLDDGSSESFAMDNVYFPQESYSKIESDFIGGSQTYLDLTVVRVNDVYSRILSIYVDGQLVKEVVIYSSYSDTLLLGSFSSGSTHILTIQIHWGGYTERGWQLTEQYVYYGFNPSSSLLY